jgi:biopolymer transport protein ExbD
MAMVILLFMWMTPTLRGLDVGLPPVAPASLDGFMRQVVVEIAADRTITLNNGPVGIGELAGILRNVLRTRRSRTVYVIGAGSLRYGEIVPLIDAAYGAGAHRVGIVTERMLESSRGPRAPREQ